MERASLDDAKTINGTFPFSAARQTFPHIFITRLGRDLHREGNCGFLQATSSTTSQFTTEVLVANSHSRWPRKRPRSPASPPVWTRAMWVAPRTNPP